MAFLSIFGRVLEYDESKPFFKIIKDNFIEVVINALKSEKSCRYPLFGFEFEFQKITIDNEKKHVYLDITAQDDILKSSKYNLHSEFQISHEYGGWMIESIHNNPFNFNEIEKIPQTIINLYTYLNNKIGQNKILSLANFPLLGVGNYFIEQDYLKLINNEEEKDEKEEIKLLLEQIKTNPYSKSIYTSDMIINRHPRFAGLTKNIRTRRGSKVEIKVPIFKDINTNLNNEPFPNFVHMDSMAFGMGCCSTQVTVGACSLNAATLLYDNLIPFTPIFLVMSSSCPIFKGKITDYDNRWKIISDSVDDRTEDERNINSQNYIEKSRYGPVYSYISDSKYSYDFNNDYRKFPINKDYYNKLIQNGISPKLSEHFCNLLVRDPLVIFSEKINIDDKNDMSHFENINSTNWNALRFKLPRSSDGDTCFKIEIRTLDLQISPYENTSMICMILLTYALILCSNEINFIIPISKVDENFKRAYKKDAINKEKFWWRIDCFKDEKLLEINCTNCVRFRKEFKRDENLTYEKDQNNIKELTINEIFNGCEKYNYPGLIVYYKKIMNFMFKTNNMNNYIDFIEKRAKGEIWTDAKYIRNFVMNHEKYKKDSIVSDEINYDLIKHILLIQNGEIKPKEIFG
jgi:glutamate--cysteine ligase catalytic subunit